MKPPRSKKDVMKLTGCMAALSRFISRLGDRGLPFFKLLRKSDKFAWNDDASKAFQELKDFLTSPPVLTAPEDGEVLLLCIAATTSIVSIVLVVECDEPVTSTRYSDLSTSSVKYSANPRHATHKCRSYCTLSSSRQESSGTTSRLTRSRWPHHIHSATSCTTRMPTAESSNGQ